MYRPVFLLICALFLMLSVPGIGPGENALFAQSPGHLIVIDPFANGVVAGDLDATFEQCIANFLAGAPELPYKEYHFECFEVVGFLFKLKLTDYSGTESYRERIYGEEGKRRFNTDEGYYELMGDVREDGEVVEENVVIGQYLFEVIALANCAEPEFTITAEKNRIDVDEETTLEIDMSCGPWQMWQKEIDLEVGGVGELDEYYIELDMNGHGEVTYTGTERGLGTITATTTNCEIWEEDRMDLSASTTVRVGEPGVEIDLSYDFSQNLGFFTSTFIVINHINAPLEVGDDGTVTGDGTVETEFEFDYQSDQCHTENFRTSGFDNCQIEGWYREESQDYMLTITISGNVYYEHVCDFGPAGEVRIPIDQPVEWNQYFAEPVVIGKDKDSTFSTTGSMPIVGGMYTIDARWEEDEEV